MGGGGGGGSPHHSNKVGAPHSNDVSWVHMARMAHAPTSLSTHSINAKIHIHSIMHDLEF